MNAYRAIGRRFRGWSVMTCDGGYGKPAHDHEPHTWNSDVVLYGPYFCPGRTDLQPRTDWEQVPE